MKTMRSLARWAWLMMKRLLRRPAYWAVLLLVPLFALALLLFSRQESGALTIALAMEDPADPAASAAVGRLTGEEGVLLFRLCGDAEEAREEVRLGRADAAWIFRADCAAQLRHFGERGRGEAVAVVQREDHALLMLSREKLFAALYPETSFEIFAAFLGEETGADDRAALRAWYGGAGVAERILRFETADGEEIADGGSYLVAPLRGILGLLLMICGMASGLFCFREEREGCFVWLSARARRWLPLLSHLAAMLPAALTALAALSLSGLSAGLGRELLMLLLYLPAAALFCELLRCLCPAEEPYSALIPVLAAAMLVLCPVFVDLDLLRPLRLLLPLGWYLRAVWSGAGLLGLLLYTLALLLLTAPALLLRQRRRGY